MSLNPSERQRRLWNAALTALAVTFLLAAALGLGWCIVAGLTSLKAILIPLAAAGVIAYLLEPVVALLERRGVRRSTAVALIHAAAALVLAIALLLIVPRLVSEITTFVERSGTYADTLVRTVRDWTARIGRHIATHPEWVDQFRPVAERHASLVATAVSSSAIKGITGITSLIPLLLGLLLIPLYTFYFLVERRTIEAGWKTYVPLRREWARDEVIRILEETNNYLITFFRGQVLVGICVGILTALGLSLVGLQYGFTLGLLVGFLTLIPYLGITVGFVAAVLMAWLQTQGWQLPAAVAAVFVVTQILEGFFITPKIMGDRVGLHPLTIIVGVLVWGQILGPVLGALLAIPLTATARVLFFRYIVRGERPGPHPAPPAETAVPPDAAV
jgi:predicted PurR-regulated permease PerM